MDITIYPEPNAALAAALTGEGVRRAVEERANTALLLYQAQVAKRTGALAASAHATAEITEVYKGEPRWVGVLTVGGRGVDYGAAHEFGRGTHEGSIHGHGDWRDAPLPPANDLNVVLEELAAY